MAAVTDARVIDVFARMDRHVLDALHSGELSGAIVGLLHEYGVPKGGGFVNRRVY